MQEALWKKATRTRAAAAGGGDRYNNNDSGSKASDTAIL